MFNLFRRRLFEDDMAAFLRKEDCSQADFIAVLRRAYAEEAPGTESENAHVNVVASR